MADTFEAIVLEEHGGKVTGAVRELDVSDLPAEGDVTVAVEYSGLNYKDGLILNGLGRLVRQYPHVPGIDFAGAVTESAHPDFKPGDKVVLTGWRVGEVWWGGYAQRARVKGDWLIHLPKGLDTQRAMAIGTAGFTSALALQALEAHGVTPDAGELLVTGAAGGVGSVAIALAARRGFKVVASSGRAGEAHDYLAELGASGFIGRTELSEGPIRPLDKERWAGAIDTVGSHTLAKLLSQMCYGGSVAACGLAGGADLPAMVTPFILRGVNLLGIDSVMCPIARRKQAWALIAETLPGEVIDEMADIAPLGQVLELGGKILQGQVRGRVVLDVNA